MASGRSQVAGRRSQLEVCGSQRTDLVLKKAGMFPSSSSAGRPGSGLWYYNVVVETTEVGQAVEFKSGSGRIEGNGDPGLFGVGRLDERTFTSLPEERWCLPWFQAEVGKGLAGPGLAGWQLGRPVSLMPQAGGCSAATIVVHNRWCPGLTQPRQPHRVPSTRPTNSPFAASALVSP